MNPTSQTKRKVRYFNTTGPCDPEMHYMLNAEERIVGGQLHRYVGDELYWVLHAPRQTGKTTFLHSWMREINSGDEAIACYVSVERCQGFAEVKESMPMLADAIRKYAEQAGIQVPDFPGTQPGSMLDTILGNWAALVAPKSLVVLFDEVDVLEGETLISFLRQLRGGFATRGVGKFPVSIALVGMRDLKDYVTAAKGGIPPNPGSPFNIKADSATLSNFSKEDIGKLFAQHTEETGRQITREALDYTYEQSKGQPWIVNSLLMRATLRILEAGSSETVTLDHVMEAREQMIMARETHLDALGERLKDPRIKNVIQKILTGEPDPVMAEGDPFRLCLDLGLVTIENGTPCISNPIYREVLARYLTYSMQLAIPAPDWQWKNPDGTLDMHSLLHEFQSFWHTNSEAWEQTADYTEAFPHLLLMAFLQRVINGGGRIEREYAAGRGRMDLAVEYFGSWDIIEVKLLRANRTFDALMNEGIRQTLSYRDSFSPPLMSKDGTRPDCYLIIFDRQPDAILRSWNDRLKWIETDEVIVVGC